MHPLGHRAHFATHIIRRTRRLHPASTQDVGRVRVRVEFELLGPDWFVSVEVPVLVMLPLVDSTVLLLLLLLLVAACCPSRDEGDRYSANQNRQTKHHTCMCCTLSRVNLTQQHFRCAN